MADFYQKMQDIGAKLLTTYNQGELVLIQIAPGAGPPNNPGAGTETAVPMKGTVSSAYSVKGALKNYGPNSLVEQGDLKVITKVVENVEPKLTDKLTINGKRFNIVKFDKVPASGIAAAWVFFVRRG